MRVGFVASVAGHAALLLWGVIAFPDAESFDATPSVNVPIELITLSDTTEIQKGEADGQIDVAPATKPNDTPQPETETPAEKPTPDPQPDPEPQPAAPPTPPTPVVEPKPDPEPQPTPDPEPAPQAPAEPKPAPEPEQAKPAETQAEPTPPKPAEAQPIVTSVSPRSKPTPPRKAPEQKEDNFKVADIQQLLDKKERKQSAGAASQAPASAGARNGTDHPGLTADEKSVVVQLIREQWNRLPDQYPPDLEIIVSFKLTRQGKLSGAPKVLNSYPDPRFNALASSAVRAVYKVDANNGFTFLPEAKYDGSNGWNEFKATLRPNDQ